MVKLVPIQVLVTGAGLENKVVDGVAISYDVDSIPSAAANIHEVTPAGEGKSSTENRRVLVSAEAEKMKQFQDAAFNGDSEKVSITVNPFGHGYTGSILGPQRKVFSSYYQNAVQLVHAVQEANSYLPHIYALSYVKTNEQTEFVNETYTNVFSMLKKLLEKRHKDFDALIKSASIKDAVSKKNLEQIHANNLSVFPIIAKICDDSESKGGNTYEGFADLPAQAKRVINTSIFNTLKSYLFSTQGQMLPILVEIGRAFQSFFVPPIASDSEYGYFKSNRERLADGLALPLEITGTTFTSSKLDNRPLQQVIVAGQPVSVTNANAGGSENIYAFLGDNTTYMVYPENPPKENGNNMPLPIPEWIPASMYTGAITPVVQSRELDINKRSEKRSELADSLKNELVGPISNIVKEFAETAYKTTALASYAALVNCTLNFSIIPGKTYAVSDEDGNTLFSGFLQGINHNISGLSSSLSASTTLSFNSVKFTNFQPPT
jgi:hypothetical protein